MSTPSYPTYRDHLARKLWLTRDARTLVIADMSTDHILASLAKCQRDNWRIAFIPIFLEELANRGFKSTHPELFV